MTKSPVDGFINHRGELYKLVKRKITYRGGKEGVIYYYKPYQARLNKLEMECKELPSPYSVYEDKNGYPRVIKMGMKINEDN